MITEQEFQAKRTSIVKRLVPSSADEAGSQPNQAESNTAQEAAATAEPRFPPVASAPAIETNVRRESKRPAPVPLVRRWDVGELRCGQRRTIA